MRRLSARPAGLWSVPPRLTTNGNINPHVWLDPGNAMAMVRAIAAALARADPGHSARYRSNASAEIARLATLDKRLKKILAPVKLRPFIVYHDAYSYFTAHYGLKAIGSVTVEPGRPVGPRRVARIRATLKSGEAVCIFREPQFPPALIATLVRGTHARIGVLDPLGADLAPGPGLYRELMTQMGDALADCLGANPR